MAVTGMGGLGPGCQQLVTLLGLSLHRLGEPIVKHIRNRRVLRVAIGPHIVKAHAAANDENVLVTQGLQGAAGVEVMGWVQRVVQ